MKPIILLITLVWYIDTNGLTFEPRTNETGIVYNDMGTTYTYYTRWHLCYYYDLTLYYDQMEKLETCVQQMNYICDKIIDDSICKITTAIFTEDLRKIRLTNGEMNKSHGRDKRAPLEFMGKLGNVIFGIMDAETARQYDDKINELQAEAERNRHLAKEKTTLIQRTLEFSNKTFSDFRDKINQLSEHIENLNLSIGSRVDEIIIGDKFRDVSNVATLIMIDHNELSTRIEAALEDSRTERISELVPLRELEKDLNAITLGKTQTLPTKLKNGMQNIGNFIKTRSTLFNNKIFVEMSIPIVGKQPFTLLKAIPIPVHARDKLFILSPTSTYFLINTMESKYIPMSIEDINGCVHFDGDKLICNPSAPVYHNPGTVCELAMLTNKSLSAMDKACKLEEIPEGDYIIQLSANNKYYIHVFRNLDLVNACEDGSVEIDTILQSGILTIEPDCTVSSKDIQMRANEHKYFNDTSLIIPNNSLTNLVLDRPNPARTSNDSARGTLLIRNNYDELKDLADQVNELAVQESTDVELKRIHYDNLSHSWALFIIGATILVLAAVAAFIIYTRVNPLSNLLSMITGVPGVRENERSVVINIERDTQVENATGTRD